MTGDVGGDSYTPWLPLQTLPSLMREILAKLQMLELHIRLALLLYLFAMRCVKFYASREMKSSLQKLHQTKKTMKLLNPEHNSPQPAKIVVYQQKGSKPVSEENRFWFQGHKTIATCNQDGKIFLSFEKSSCNFISEK